MTGFRRNEALRPRGNDCHPQKGYIALPDTKTGAQLRCLGKVSFDGLILKGGFWVFPGCRGGGHFVGLPKCLAWVTAAAGIAGGSALTLRHTFAATVATLGYSELTIAGLLGHAAGSVTARYAHVADIALESVATRTADAVAAALAGVVSLGRQRRKAVRVGIHSAVFAMQPWSHRHLASGYPKASLIHKAQASMRHIFAGVKA